MKPQYNGSARFKKLTDSTQVILPVKKNYLAVIGTFFTIAILLGSMFLLVSFYDLVSEGELNFLFILAMLLLLMVLLPMLFLNFYNLF